MPFKTPQQRKEYAKKYYLSEKGVLAREKYRASGKRKAYMYNYNRLEKTLAYRKRYNESKGKRFSEERRIRRDATYVGMGGKCASCGFNDFRALQIDHVNADGKRERHLLNSRNYYPSVLESFNRGENRYQLLCCNCNWIKRVENNEYRKAKDQ